MEDVRLEILKNEKVGMHTYLMVLKLNHSYDIKPGHFVMIKPNDSFDPLNRRAFAIADVEEDAIYIYYDVVGKGTAVMSTLRKGEFVDVLMPLGNGLFEASRDKLNVVLAGGIGISGVSLFCRLLKEKNLNFKVYYGARSKEYLVMLDWFSKYSIPIEVYTDDGSFGKKGFVTDALKNIDSANIYACGPSPMLKAVQNISKQKGFDAYLSLENPMACGYGVCLGCVVKTSDGYVRTCVEGPVFKSDEIIL
ncbi:MULTISPECIES: dihydroorotate dehydrogenase electron transfer subunit [unclassified Hydrogenobaculum]|jgi:2-polyprenylphenol hydroxylase and related flavodoxin oxidoreductases|uniref:dihydroorotate dehydrogenase electron transfer subunit n=1 Tax=unclassified Hydrogenobaculum TaxID=2622382 RepID=UPI0001C52210|nr:MULTISPECIES: dihydroorotate dehydrogenase electron transfer subunit [unclassified Hydrogenobaculum]AEF19900.1 Dihydroorotate dehydrogenase, electron transfer subunit, iron-sulfur cluster binding domain protein [Hydrogenobaculum sp. 3684]AEG47186.1 oxidoreductase FAD/NAD(P)-binding domain protein [Hydrogenobaculum sp. SHO]AGG15834.1 oxidoreductase FAD/NAD(P)-binding domain protein [Hydrogenobaculum sp. HO]AGH94134.1 2-polyprenylphenol hydroxylase-like oxidoreductase [Hydrogenobaculum sp. SN]